MYIRSFLFKNIIIDADGKKGISNYPVAMWMWRAASSYAQILKQSAYTSNIYSLCPGDNQLGFVANIVGRHILVFSINNQARNVAIVDVQGSITQRSNWKPTRSGCGV